MTLSRYSILDTYTFEELRRDYEAANPLGRIQILKKLQGGERPLPFEIASIAVRDPSSLVRAWVARQGLFGGIGLIALPIRGEDYLEKFHLIFEALKTDSDPFVRACLYENPAACGLSGGLTSRFLDATHIERLALMRNPKVGTKLVEVLFDPENREFALTLGERAELCRAFLSNESKLHELADDAGQCRLHNVSWKSQDFLAGMDLHEAERFLCTLWRLALKWPQDSDIARLIVQIVPADGLTFLDAGGSRKCVKAEVYRQRADLRWLIIDGCGPGDGETISLGLQDADEGCRAAAYSKLSPVPLARTEEIIKRKDKAALVGLAQNEALSVERLRKVEECLRQINPDGFPDAWLTIQKKEKATLFQDPRRLFGDEGRGFLEEKINLIGNTLVGALTGREGPLQKLEGTLWWGRVAAVASVLILIYLFLK